MILLHYFPLNVLSLMFFPPTCSRTRIMTVVSLTNYPPPLNTETERRRELPLLSLFILQHAAELMFLSCAWLKVALKNLPSPSPPMASPHEHLLFIFCDRSSVVGCGQFCGCACLRLSLNHSWDLTRLWLTSLSLAKQHQQHSRCQTCAGRVEGRGCQHFRKVEHKCT